MFVLLISDTSSKAISVQTMFLLLRLKAPSLHGQNEEGLFLLLCPRCPYMDTLNVGK